MRVHAYACVYTRGIIIIIIIIITTIIIIIIILIIIIIIITPTTIIIIRMKNFTRRSSHGLHGSKRRDMAQHAQSRGSHAFTVLTHLHHHSCNHVL